MAAKVIRIPEFRGREVEASAESLQPEGSTGSWDPYEVWRTRVLQPRLDESRVEQRSAEQRGGRSFFATFAKLLGKKTD